MNDKDRLAKLESEKDQLEAKLATRRAKLNSAISRVRGRLSAKERKADTRRKILVGSMVLTKSEDNQARRAALLAELDAYLDRDRDRALFELPPRSAADDGS